jgi:stalled ribosome rescue protein Dom34
MSPKKNYKRGYSVALLVAFGENGVALWSIFSRVIKPLSSLSVDGDMTDSKVAYGLYERTINALRSALKEGVRSIILVSPPRTPYSRGFKDHVAKHHAWLMQGPSRIALAEITGFATTHAQVTELASNPAFRKIIDETTSEETTKLLELLEARIGSANPNETAIYTIQEAENAVLYPKGNAEADYLLLTDKFLSSHHNKARLNRLLQVASNKKVRTKVLNAESPAGKRLTQFGGFVCLLKSR